MVQIVLISCLLTIVLGTTVSMSLPILEDAVLIEGNELGEGDDGAFDDAEEIDLSDLDRSLFGKPDNETTGAAVARYNPDTEKVNPEELGSYLEGDMLMPSGPGRNGMISRSLRWPKATIPYVISGRFSAQEKANINYGINEYHKKTCIRFKPRTTESDYISIVNGNTGCWSSVGKVGGKQELNLQSPGCTVKAGTFMHEMMHALGFLHEQNRHERDSFISVQWDNIQSGVTHNFNKASASSTSDFGVAYDYGSIMHYSAFAFSKNGRATIVAKQSASGMGQREAFSKKDLKKINAMYKCPGSTNSRPANGADTSNSKPPKRPSLLTMIGSLFGGKTDSSVQDSNLQGVTTEAN